jgi:hypothetical protein
MVLPSLKLQPNASTTFVSAAVAEIEKEARTAVHSTVVSLLIIVLLRSHEKKARDNPKTAYHVR